MSEENIDIEDLILKTLETTVQLPSVSDSPDCAEDSKNDLNENTICLIYPKYSNKSDQSIRISEQEFKQCFIATLEKNRHSYLYSIETPTTCKYLFSKVPIPRCTYDPKDPELTEDNKTNSESARIDVTLYDKSDKKIRHHIEFKAKLPAQKSILKDMLKLAHEEENCTHYFLHILDNSNSGSIYKAINRLYSPDLSKFSEKEMSAFYIDLKDTLKKTNNKIVVYILEPNYTSKNKPQKHYYRFCFNDFLEFIDYEKEEINDIKKKISEILGKIELRPLS